jgi:hypothetical protein
VTGVAAVAAAARAGPAGANGVPAGAVEPSGLPPAGTSKCTVAIGPVLPAASVARTSNVWRPAARPGYARGDEHAANAPVSRRHVMDADSLGWNAIDGDALVLAPSDGESIVIAGATVSTTNERVTGKPPVASTAKV